MTHTPGPFQVGEVHQDWTEIWGPDDSDGSHDILGSTIGPDQKPNAYLWAAAPELLATLKLMLDWWKDTSGAIKDVRMDDYAEIAEAAIARAE